MKRYLTVRTQTSGLGYGTKWGTVVELANDVVPPEGSVSIPADHPFAAPGIQLNQEFTITQEEIPNA